MQGGDVNISNNTGESAIFIAISVKRLDLVEKLIALGADLSKQNHSQETALHIALDTKHQDIALAIAREEKNINNLTNYAKETPVWIH